MSILRVPAVEWLTYILPSLTSRDYAINHIKYSFAIGLGIFIVLAPWYRSRKSFFDAIAAKKVAVFLRIFLTIEFFCLVILLYFSIKIGSPISSNEEALSFGNGQSWLYSFTRPTSGIIFLLFGIIGEMHPAPRYLCLIGCVGEIFGDALSAVQVLDQYNARLAQDAPSNGYTTLNLQIYYWRDIISLGLCTTIFFLTVLLMCIVGLCNPQLIPFKLLSDPDYDRCAVMNNQRATRRDILLRNGYDPAPNKALKRRHLDPPRRRGDGLDEENKPSAGMEDEDDGSADAMEAQLLLEHKLDEGLIRDNNAHDIYNDAEDDKVW